jgi:hypothetical protein
MRGSGLYPVKHPRRNCAVLAEFVQVARVNGTLRAKTRRGDAELAPRLWSFI